MGKAMQISEFGFEMTVSSENNSKFEIRNSNFD